VLEACVVVGAAGRIVAAAACFGALAGSLAAAGCAAVGALLAAFCSALVAAFF